MLALATMVNALAAQPSIGERIATVARTFMVADPTPIRHCNHLVVDVLDRVGHPLQGDVRGLHAAFSQRGWLHERERPAPGDIAFFDYTWDKNGNGRRDDRLTHVAIVVGVDEHGTIELVHRGSSTRTLVMNLSERGRTTDGRTTNSYLARRDYGQPGKQLASELFATFATVSEADDAHDTPRIDRLAQEPTLTRRQRRRARRAARAVHVARLPRISEENDPSPLHPVRRGEPLPTTWTHGARCSDLWLWRNAIYARHGYAFTTERAREAFNALDWYVVDDRVDAQTIRLTAVDVANREAIRKHESTVGCSRDR